MTIVDFEVWVQTKYKISSDMKYVKEKKDIENVHHKKGEIRCGQ